MNNTPEFIPSIKDLEDIFSRLPDANKCRDNTLKVKVAIRIEQYHDIPVVGSGGQMVKYRDRLVEDVPTPCELTFVKFKENETNCIWLYEGKIRYKDAEPEQKNTRGGLITG